MGNGYTVAPFHRGGLILSNSLLFPLSPSCRYEAPGISPFAFWEIGNEEGHLPRLVAAMLGQVGDILTR